MARRAVEELQPEFRLHALYLSRDGALRQPGCLTSAGEATVLGNEMKKLQLVKVERPGGEEFIHGAHHCNRANEFPAIVEHSHRFIATPGIHPARD
jgi:hypothetical protein